MLSLRCISPLLRHFTFPWITALLAVGLAPPLAGQQREIELGSWHSVSSRHFVLLTDADPERGEELVRRLEVFRSAFATLAPQLELRSVVPTTFIAFRDRHSYAPFKPIPDGSNGSTQGYFLRHPDRNFLTLDASVGEGPGLAVIYHEFVHYLVAHNFDRVPRWFHEGMAEYYSTLAIEDDSVYLGRPILRHARWLQADDADRKVRFLSHDFSLREVLAGESGSHIRRADGFYAMSWTLVHYLLTSGTERLDQLADYLVRLRNGEDPDDAFENAFDLHLDQLEETLRAHAESALPATPGAYELGEDFPVTRLDLGELETPEEPVSEPLPPDEVLFHLGNLLLQLGHLEGAEGFFVEALERRPEHAEALAGLALLRALDGRLEEAELFFQDALEIGPADALTYLRYGRHLLARIVPEAARGILLGGPLPVNAAPLPVNALTCDEAILAVDELAATAREVLRGAVDRDREFAEPRVLLGYAYRFGEVDPQPGIVALQKARGWLPDRDELRSILIQLYLKNEDFARARRLERSIIGRDAEEARLWALEEIDRAEALQAAGKAFDEGRIEEALRFFDEAIAITGDQALRDRLAARLSWLEEHHAVP